VERELSKDTQPIEISKRVLRPCKIIIEAAIVLPKIKMARFSEEKKKRRNDGRITAVVFTTTLATVKECLTGYCSSLRHAMRHYTLLITSVVDW